MSRATESRNDLERFAASSPFKLRNDGQRSRLNRRQNGENFWHQRTRVRQAIAAGLECDDSDRVISQVLLMNHAAIHGQQCIELLRGGPPAMPRFSALPNR